MYQKSIKHTNGKSSSTYLYQIHINRIYSSNRDALRRGLEKLYYIMIIIWLDAGAQGMITTTE